MRERGGLGLAAVVVVATVVGGAALAHLGPFAKSLRTPEIVGVIEKVDNSGAYGPRVTLADGREVSPLLQGVKGSEGHGYAPLPFDANPLVGNLLIAGNEPSPWYTSPPHITNLTDYAGRHLECYMLGGSGTENTDSFDFDYGLRLAKAPDFDPVGANGHDFSGGACLDAQGRVKSVGYQGN